MRHLSVQCIFSKIAWDISDLIIYSPRSSTLKSMGLDKLKYEFLYQRKKPLSTQTHTKSMSSDMSFCVKTRPYPTRPYPNFDFLWEKQFLKHESSTQHISTYLSTSIHLHIDTCNLTPLPRVNLIKPLLLYFYLF